MYKKYNNLEVGDTFPIMVNSKDIVICTILSVRREDYLTGLHSPHGWAFVDDNLHQKYNVPNAILDDFEYGWYLYPYNYTENYMELFNTAYDLPINVKPYMNILHPWKGIDE